MFVSNHGPTGLQDINLLFLQYKFTFIKAGQVYAMVIPQKNYGKLPQKKFSGIECAELKAKEQNQAGNEHKNDWEAHNVQGNANSTRRNINAT